MRNPNKPIGFSVAANVVLMEDGRFVPLARWAGQPRGPVFRDPRSRKEERQNMKTAKLALRRVHRGGRFL